MAEGGGAGNILIRVGADTTEAVRKLADVRGPLSDVQTAGERAGGALHSAMLPAVAVLGTLGVAAHAAADKASDLNESVNAVQQVFGTASGKIQAFSQVAAREAGLSMQQLNELVTPVGASLQNVGFSADQAANASISLAKRAADMASVFNVDVSEAMEAIQSGLRGEADPLERFGVGLSAAAVQAEAMKMHLAASTDALTAHDLAQARLALIMDQSSKVAGDFSRTSDQLANSQRINAAESANQAAQLGTGLLPVMKLYQGVLGAVIGFTSEHTTATKVLVLAVAGLAAGIVIANGAMKVYEAGQIAVRGATAAWTAGQWLLNAALTANPIGVVVVAVAALAAGIILAYRHSQTFRDAVSAAWAVLRDSPIGAVVGEMQSLVGAVQSLVGWLANIHWPSPPAWLSKVGGSIGGLFSVTAPGAAAAARGTVGGPATAARLAPAKSGPVSTSSGDGSITINIHGATDPEGTARQVNRVLRSHTRRQGALGRLANAGGAG